MKIYTETVARAAYQAAASTPVCGTSILLDVAGHRTHVTRLTRAYWGVGICDARQPFSSTARLSYVVIWQHADGRYIVETYNEFGHRPEEIGTAISLVAAICIATAWNARIVEKAAA